MKISRPIRLLALAVISTAYISACKDNVKQADPENSTEQSHQEMNAQQGESASEIQPSTAGEAISAYLKLKDALVADNSDKAALAGKDLAQALGQMEVKPEIKKQLQEHLEDARALALELSNSSLKDQRMHFKPLSSHMISIVEVAGTSQKLYQQYCPMYNQNQGGVWLSNAENIQNPYFGNKMLNCGVVQQEFN